MYLILYPKSSVMFGTHCVSFQSSPYNSCLDWSKTWCKFVYLFFLSFSTVKKCDERKKHVGHKYTLRATQGVRPVTTSFREFVRDYWLRSYPAEANRSLWREDINAGRILFGHTSYIPLWVTVSLLHQGFTSCFQFPLCIVKNKIQLFAVYK